MQGPSPTLGLSYVWGWLQVLLCVSIPSYVEWTRQSLFASGVDISHEITTLYGAWHRLPHVLPCLGHMERVGGSSANSRLVYLRVWRSASRTGDLCRGTGPRAQEGHELRKQLCFTFTVLKF